MPIIPINELGKIGLVTDLKPHEIPLNAWTRMENMRARGRFMERFLGQTQTSIPPVAPYAVLFAPADTANLWVVAGLTAIYGTTDFSSYTDLTRSVGGAYSATADQGWTKMVSGEVAYLNNGNDIPQVWLPKTAMVTDFANLPNWDVNWRCNALRAYRNYLIALDVTKSGTRYATMVKWSHPADPQQAPSSWDAADPTKDCGEYTISDTPGYVLDCLPLGDLNIIYKEDSVWGMQFVGGVFVFRFFKLFDWGMKGKRMVASTPRGHLVYTGDDLIFHNGQTFNSVLQDKAREWLNDRVDGTYIGRSFCITNYRYNEVWFCFVLSGSGATIPNTALVWNYQDNTVTWRSLPGVYDCEASPVNTPVSGDLWSGDTAAWSTDTSTWGDRTFTGAFRKLLMASPTNTRLYLADDGETWAGTGYDSLLERVGMGIPLEAGAPPDLLRTKVLKEVWPRLTGPGGQSINIYCGYQREVESPITWQGPFPFVIGQDRKINPLMSGKLFSIRYETSGTFTWQLHGHEFNVEPGGRY